MKVVYLGLVSVLFSVSACGPRDVALESANGRNSGPAQAAVFSEAGVSPSKCKKDYSFLNSPLDRDADVFKGKLKAMISAGTLNCFKIGSEVTLQDNPSAAIRAKAKISKVEIIKVDDLDASHAEAMGMSLSEVKAYAVQVNDRLKAEKNKDAGGFISLTYFELIPGSFDASKVTTNGTTTDEDEEDGDAAVNPNLTITLMAADGDRSPTCPADKPDYSSLTSPDTNDANVLAGKVKAVMAVGERNCYRVGATLPVKNTSKKTDVERFQVLVTQVQIVPIAKISKIHAVAMGMSLAELTALANKLNSEEKAKGKFPTNDTVSFTFFEVMKNPAVEESAPEEPSEEAPEIEQP